MLSFAVKQCEAAPYEINMPRFSASQSSTKDFFNRLLLFPMQQNRPEATHSCENTNRTQKLALSRTVLPNQLLLTPFLHCHDITSPLCQHYQSNHKEQVFIQNDDQAAAGMKRF